MEPMDSVVNPKQTRCRNVVQGEYAWLIISDYIVLPWRAGGNQHILTIFCQLGTTIIIGTYGSMVAEKTVRQGF